ncbi:MAG: hypothetical protein C0499_02320 [Zymomonas sp.]|nr:hypothetical protein [Zymomonas sp.]
MPSIVSYRKYIDAEITRTLRLPDDPATRQAQGTELATLANGLTYVSLPDGAVLPMSQPPEIAASIAPVALTDALRAELKAASPHVQLINERVRQRIAQRYSLPDEIKMLRTAPSAESTAYNAYVEECRDWGRAQKAALGL